MFRCNLLFFQSRQVVARVAQSSEGVSAGASIRKGVQRIYGSPLITTQQVSSRVHARDAQCHRSRHSLPWCCPTCVSQDCTVIQTKCISEGPELPRFPGNWALSCPVVSCPILFCLVTEYGVRCCAHAIAQALDDEDFILWIDVDLQSYPVDVIQVLLATNKYAGTRQCRLTVFLFPVAA